VRFVLALALRYLLTPLIDILSCHGTSSKWKLPRGVAIVVALIIASGVMTFLGVVIAKSIGSFAAHADVYGKRVERLLENAMNLTAQFDGYVPGVGGANDLQQTVTQLARNHLSISGLILNLLGTAARYIENIIYILLFLAFLLAGSKPRSIQGDGDVHFEAEEQIYIYIRGKVAVALLVALCDAAILASVGLKLWLVFGVLTFWLNFIPVTAHARHASLLTQRLTHLHYTHALTRMHVCSGLLALSCDRTWGWHSVSSCPSPSCFSTLPLALSPSVSHSLGHFVSGWWPRTSLSPSSSATLLVSAQWRSYSQ
jgi:hypothetical protein